MNDDYKRGFITGMAMQPLYVSKGGGEEISENFCAPTALPATLIDEVYCKQINFEEEI